MSSHIPRGRGTSWYRQVGIVKGTRWQKFAIPLSPGGNRVQVNRFLRHGLNLRPRIKDGKVFTPGPELIEVAVMGAIDVTRLTGIVDANGMIPIRGVHDDLERPSSRLVVVASSGVDGVLVAAARKFANVEPCPLLRTQAGTERMI